MSKKVALINDLSGFGRCSLTAAIPVLATMGVQPCPVPTALLSAQTGFPDYYCETCAHILPAFADKWEQMGAQFDGIYTGFFTEVAQVDAMTDFVDRFKTDDTHVLVDPILGDDGVTYKFYTEELREHSLRLVERATIITPNLTELCILTGADFADLDHDDWSHLQEQIAALCADFAKDRDLSILVTGIGHVSNEKPGEGTPAPAEATNLAGDPSQVSGSTGAATSVFFEKGFDRIATGVYTEGKWTTCDAPLLPGSFSGTGDLFASVIIAAAVRGRDLVDGVQHAQHFLSAAITDSIASGIYPPEGTDFEPHLSLLADAAWR